MFKVLFGAYLAFTTVEMGNRDYKLAAIMGVMALIAAYGAHITKEK